MTSLKKTDHQQLHVKLSSLFNDHWQWQTLWHLVSVFTFTKKYIFFLIEVQRDFSMELEVANSILQNDIFQDNFLLVTLNKNYSG